MFGRELGHVPSVCVYMSDGTQVTVAEFLVDVCNLVRRNITVEGIFRKAGSSQRQSDIKVGASNDFRFDRMILIFLLQLLLSVLAPSNMLCNVKLSKNYHLTKFSMLFLPQKLIDSGSSLPNSVHVIDGACLLKQFLRSLPTPLLSSEVHNKTIKYVLWYFGCLWYFSWLPFVLAFC